MGTDTGSWTRLTRGTGLIAAAALATVLGAALLTAGTTAPAAAAARPFDGGRTAFSGTAAPMGQTNGAVWTLEVAGGRVYAGGNFTTVRASGSSAGGPGDVPQGSLAAFSASTGAPVSSFRPALSNTDGSRVVVRASVLSPDGTRLFVGGDFNRVNGDRIEHIAEFDARTGAFIGGVGDPGQGGTGVDNQVHSLAVSPDGRTLYVGGAFRRAGNLAQQPRLAAFDLTSPTRPVVQSFRPQIDTKLFGETLRVTALGVSGDGQRVFVGGPFGSVGGRPVQGFAVVRAADGSDAGWRGDYLRGPRSWTTSIEVDRGTVYFGARSDNGQQDWPNRTEGVYAVDDSTGEVRWYANCYGDTFGIQVAGNDVYVASHAHDCRAIGGHPETSPRMYLAIQAVNRTTGRAKPYFVQTEGQGIDGDSYYLSRALATDGRQLFMGGGFARVNGRTQSNLTRFPSGSALPEPVTPRATTCRGCASATVSFPRSWDRDDVSLTYRVYRGTAKRPVRTFVRESVKWDPGRVQFKDTKVKRGQKVRYRLKVSDPSGRGRTSQTRMITIGRP